MSNKSVLDLTLLLSQALDQNYDVVNMDTVLAVISALEGTSITKEQLEATRLAKYINQLRRRTTSENLAKRAKSLLKKWREMVGMQQTNNDQQHNQSLFASNINISTISYDNTNTNLQFYQPNMQTHPQQFYNDHSSLPTSPNTSDLSYEHNMNQKSLFTPELLRSIKSANSNTNKRFDNSSKMLSSSSSTTNAKSTGNNGKHHPINFSNLICHISSAENSSTATTSFSRKTQQNDTDTLTIDHSSNSNSDIQFSTNRISKLNSIPIVIDSDSNSHSTVIPKTKTVLENSLCSNNLLAASKTYAKSKKTKKLKKREKDISNKILEVGKKTINIIEESSSNQQERKCTKLTSVGELLHPIKLEETRYNNPITSISEILSISNSSLSTMFPHENNSKGTDLQNKYGLSTSNSHSSTVVAKSDLTFAGKFKQSNKTSNEFELPDANEMLGMGHTSDSSNPCGTYKHSTMEKLIKFKSFNNRGKYNSNDSSSSSRTSLFETIDSSQHNQMQIVDKLRVRSKLDASSNYTSCQQKIITKENFTTAQSTTTDGLVTELYNFPEISSLPKKRGRKKGSKGVDSIIAKETSLSSQFLINTLGSGGKKVKTTKELYAEMQNRKLGSGFSTSPNLANWSSLPPHTSTSRPTSSCSEPSVYSPCTLDACHINSTASTGVSISKLENLSFMHEVGCSDSDTIITDHSHDSLAIKGLQRCTSFESNSSSLEHSRNTNISTVTNDEISKIDMKLAEFLKGLPQPFDTDAIESKYVSKLIPCTCTIVEVKNPHAENYHYELEKKNIKSDLQATVTEHNKWQGSDKSKLKTKSPQQQTIKKPIKSIFDVDFDENEDPIHQYKAEAVATSLKTLEQNKDQGNLRDIAIDWQQSNEITKKELLFGIDFNQMPSALQTPIASSYQVIEDLKCLAKQRFELQTQQITKFHINALHNCYIPNVNGNWDNSTTIQLLNDTVENLSTYLVSDGSDVVPKYGSLINKRIEKKLSAVHFAKTFQRKATTLIEKNLYNIPFLGVAKCLPICKKQKNILNNTLDKNNQNRKKSNVNSKTNEPTSTFIDKDNNTQADLISVNNENVSLLEIDVSEASMYDLRLKSGNDEYFFQTDQKYGNLLTIAPTGETDILLKCVNNDVEEITNQVNEDFNKLELVNNSLGKNDTTAQIHFSRRSSSSSNSSLIETQQSINQKLRSQRRQLIQQQEQVQSSSIRRKRKKLKKQIDKEKQRFKRIKIAINGDVVTQKQLKVVIDSSNSGSSDDDDCQQNTFSMTYNSNTHDYNNVSNYLSNSTIVGSVTAVDNNENDMYDYDTHLVQQNANDQYAIVQRSANGNSSKHIVLTIKKTPSKTNSPVNSDTVISPTSNEATTAKNLTMKSAEKMHTDEASTNRGSICNIPMVEFKKEKEVLTLPKTDSKPIRRSRFFRKTKRCNLFGHEYGANSRKLHRQLFFGDELFFQQIDQTKMCILNLSSCSSSCAEETDNIDEGCYNSNSIKICEPNNRHNGNRDVVNTLCMPYNRIEEVVAHCANNECSSLSDNHYDEYIIETNDAVSDNTIKTTNTVVKVEPSSDDTETLELQTENNGFLPSFNNIYLQQLNTDGMINQQQQSVVKKKQQPIYLQNQNCDDTNLNNNNSYNLFKYNLANNPRCYSSVTLQNIYSNNSIAPVTEATNPLTKTTVTTTEKQQSAVPYKEYRTGLRAVNENIADTDNYSHIQQFKEWYQVLQLRTYNEELLTVLPYVVLE